MERESDHSSTGSLLKCLGQPEARNPELHMVPHVVGQNSGIWTIIHCFSGTVGRNWIGSEGVKTENFTVIWDVGVTSGSLTHIVTMIYLICLIKFELVDLVFL